MGLNNNQMNLFDIYSDSNIVHKPSGVVTISNNLIRGKGKINKKSVKRGNKVIQVSDTTANDKKIEDACIELFQAKEVIQKVSGNYETLKGEALKELIPKFEEYGLVENEEYSIKKNEDIREKKQIAIDNYVKDRVSKLIPQEFVFPIKDFIQRTGIARIQSRFNEALTTIHNASQKVSYSWMEQTISFEEVNGEKIAKINNTLLSGSIIPMFGLKFNDKLEKVLSKEEIKNMTIESFIEMNLPNKVQYVDSIKMELSPKTLVNIVGIGLFGGNYGKGFAKSLRKNRNKFRKSITFQFDLLLRSLINTTKDSHLRRFTFNEIKEHLHAQSYKSWEAFKKSVLLPSIEEINELTEIDCGYKLVPNQKEWTHIQLLTKWKCNSMGFEASKFNYDYLAYFIAVQHKYFQQNRLSDKLESFLPYVQGELYSSGDDVEMYGRTVEEWKEYGKKVYSAEQELLSYINENKDFLDANNLIYDEKRMCLVIRNFKDNEEVEIDVLDGVNVVKTTKLKKTSYITSNNGYKVTCPISSLRYLNECGATERADAVYIFEFIPFKFATIDAKWNDINNLEDYNKMLDPIRIAAYHKKFAYFKFDTEVKKESFLYYLSARRFKEFDDIFRENMEKAIGGK